MSSVIVVKTWFTMLKRVVVFTRPAASTFAGGAVDDLPFAFAAARLRVARSFIAAAVTASGGIRIHIVASSVMAVVATAAGANSWETFRMYGISRSNSW